MICLTHEEIKEITHRQKHSAQHAALNAMGIDHKIRPDGSVMVTREALNSSTRPTQHKRKEPNWEGLKHG